MAWIETIAPERAEGLLRRIYDAAVRRAGRVYRIVQLQSRRPEALRLTTQLYVEVMHSTRSVLTRAQREMIAVTVSRANGCRY